jgi:hypothetical protein
MNGVNFMSQRIGPSGVRLPSVAICNNPRRDHHVAGNQVSTQSPRHPKTHQAITALSNEFIRMRERIGTHRPRTTNIRPHVRRDALKTRRLVYHSCD